MNTRNSSADLYKTIARPYLDEQERFFAEHVDAARQFMYPRVAANPQPGTKLLDIGCGGGKDVAFFLNAGYDAWGIDSSPEMVRQARQSGLPRNRIIHGDIVSTHKLGGGFDLVYSRFALHYCRRINPAYKKIASLMKPGGRIIVVVAHPLADFLHTKRRAYGKQLRVFYPLYGGLVTVEYAAHTFEDYFSKLFLELFNLEEVTEEPTAFREDPSVPGFLGFVARRK